MKDPSNRPAAAAVPRANLSRIGRIVLGLSVSAIGGALASIMAVATLYEFLALDFFGVCVAGLVTVFGAQLVRIGYDAAMGRRTTPVAPDPAATPWHSNTRMYRSRRCSNLDIEGR